MRVTTVSRPARVRPRRPGDRSRPSPPIGSLLALRRSATPSVLPSFPWVGLLTLAGAIFVSVTSEFLPTGLLPDMAHDLGVSVGTTGLLVTVFAVSVVAATTPLTTLTRRYSRKRLVVLVLLT